MQLPVDIKAVIDEATDIDAARMAPLSVSVYIDDTAPNDVVAHVRSAFASASAHTRVTITYLLDQLATPFPGDDMVVIVAGFSERVGEHAENIRSAGVPVMVVSTMPSLVMDTAVAFKHPIPEADLVAPKQTDGEELVALDEEQAAALDNRMGQWIIEACMDKRLSFALAFPFVRRPLAVESVMATSWQNAGIGVVVVLPGADMPVMTLNQAKMLLQIAAAYGEPLDASRIKELAAIVGGAFACRSVARQIAGAVPFLGWLVKGGIGFGGTYAMGQAAIEYFEGGGNINGVANVLTVASQKSSFVTDKIKAMFPGEEPEEEKPLKEAIASISSVDDAVRVASRIKDSASTVANSAMRAASVVVRH